MKRFFSALLVVLQISASLLLFSCEQRGDFLSYQSEAFCASVVYMGKNGQMAGEMKREKDGSRRFSFTAPDTLAGISLLSDASGRYFLTYEGMTEEVSAKAEEALAAFALLSLTPTARIRYIKDGAAFATEGGEATVKKNENGAPVFIALQTKQGQLSLTLSSWEELP